MDRARLVTLPALARLLGAPEALVRNVLRSEGAALESEAVTWSEAAGYLFDAWPRAEIVAALGADSLAVPAAFRPAPVPWLIPPFIVRAMEHQAALLRARDPRVDASAGGRFVSPAVEDYVADVLFGEIETSTVEDLANDAAFNAAYHYPSFD